MKVAKAIKRITIEEGVSGVIVGYPVLPSGGQSPLCREIESLIARFELMGLVGPTLLFMCSIICDYSYLLSIPHCSPSHQGEVPCTLWDERLSSSRARRLTQTLAGRAWADRKSSKASLGSKDSMEAAIILQVLYALLVLLHNEVMELMLLEYFNRTSLKVKPVQLSN